VANSGNTIDALFDSGAVARQFVGDIRAVSAASFGAESRSGYLPIAEDRRDRWHGGRWRGRPVSAVGVKLPVTNKPHKLAAGMQKSATGISAVSTIQSRTALLAVGQRPAAMIAPSFLGALRSA